MPTFDRPDWLPATKFHPPHVRPDLIPRPALQATLNQALADYPLTLLSAPAGYGKTTLLSEWIEGLRSDSDIILAKAAWLSIDESDNDPVRFVTALVFALEPLVPEFGEATRRHLKGTGFQTEPGVPDVQLQRTLGAFINDILDAPPDTYVLVLDDLHLIHDETVLGGLDFLLERLPENLRIVITTRADPPLALAKMRARGTLAEIRLGELRFSDSEMQTLLNERLQIGLAPEDLQLLAVRTEGWPVGLRLLAGSLQQIGSEEERSDFLANLAESDRFVFDFLANEVLRLQSDEVRAFLLQTSILSELSAELCRSVTGNAEAGRILAELYEGNVFLVRVESPANGVAPGVARQPVYRYHALFADFLRAHFQQEFTVEFRQMHLRAAHEARELDQALQHFLAAEEWDASVELIESQAAGLVQQGQVETLQSWIEKLPERRRKRDAHLWYWRGVCAFQVGALRRARDFLNNARSGYKADRDEAGLGRTLAELAQCNTNLNAPVEALKQIEQALELPLRPATRVHLLANRTFLYTLWDRATLQLAAQDFAAAQEIVRDSDDAEVLFQMAYNFEINMGLLPAAMDFAEEFNHQVHRQLGDTITPLHAAAARLQAMVHLWRGRYSDALADYRSALKLGEQVGGFFNLEVDVAYLRFIIHTARGEYVLAEQAAYVFREPPAHLRDYVDTVYALGFQFQLARSYWIQGQLDDARSVYAQKVNDLLLRALNKPTRNVFDGLVYLTERRYRKAEKIFRTALKDTEKWPFVSLSTEPRLLLAYLYLQWERPKQVREELLSVLDECAQNDSGFLILREGQIMIPVLEFAIEAGIQPSYARQLLPELQIEGADAYSETLLVPETCERLTKREIELLSFLVSGASNKAIAATLVISENTVKNHLRNIYAKLAVTNRTSAAERARSLGVGPHKRE